MYQILYLTLLTFLSSILHAQRQYLNICNDSMQIVSFDTGMTFVSYDLLNQDSFSLKISVSKNYNEKSYYGYPVLNQNGDKNNYSLLYFREDVSRNLYIYDTVQNKEILIIPINQNMIGYETSVNMVSGKCNSIVIDYHAELTTSECIYQDLILVGIKRSEESSYKDFSYFKRGVGWVASSRYDELRVYLVAKYIER